MGIAMRALLFSLALVLSYQDDPEPVSLQGRVVRAGTSEPVTKAFVQLLPADAGSAKSLSFFEPTPVSLAGRDNSISARTDSEGRFSFTNVIPGRYRVAARRDGYSRAEYLQRGNNERGAVIVLGGAEPPDDIVIEMVPAGTITGVVRDESGATLGRMTVSAYSVEYVPGGGRELRLVQAEETNELGEYRLYWLTPGEYYVTAGSGQLHDITTLIRQNVVDPMPRYPTLYYPGTLVPETAERILVREAEIIGGIDFTMKHVQLPAVRGRFPFPQADVRLPEWLLTLIPADFRGRPDSTASRIDPDGRFEISNVPPGQYLLSTGSLVVPLEIGASDVEGVNVAAPPIVIQGVIRTEAGEPFRKDASISIQFLDTQLPGAAFTADWRDEGTFMASGWSGEFEISFTNLPAGYFVKQMFAMGRDATGESLSLPAGMQSPLDLEIVLGRHDGVLTGNVTAADGSPAPGAVVVLVPDGTHQRFARYPSSSTDVSGSFEVHGAPPGKYIAYAFEDAAGDRYYDAEFMRSQTGKGTPVVLTAGSDTTVKLDLIAR